MTKSWACSTSSWWCGWRWGSAPSQPSWACWWCSSWTWRCSWCWAAWRWCSRGRVAPGPELPGEGRRGGGQGTEDQEGGGQSAGPAEPAGEGIGDQPAGVRQGELGREEGGAVGLVAGAADQAAGRRLDQRRSGAEQDPERQQEQVARAQRAQEQAAGQQRATDQQRRPVGMAVEPARQQQGRQHRAGARGGEGERGRGLAAAQDLAYVDHRVDDHHRAGQRDRQVERQQGAQARRREEGAAAEADAGDEAAGAGTRLWGGQAGGEDQAGGGQEGEGVEHEEGVVAEDQERRRGQAGAEQGLQVVGQARERKGADVARLLGQQVRDGRLEAGGEAGRAGVDQEDQGEDLPDLGDEGQAGDQPGAGEVERDQQRPARQAVCEAADERRDQDVGDHLEREGGAEHPAGLAAGEVVGEQRQRDGREPGADQGDHLGREEPPEAGLGQRRQACGAAGHLRPAPRPAAAGRAP